MHCTSSDGAVDCSDNARNMQQEQITLNHGTLGAHPSPDPERSQAMRKRFISLQSSSPSDSATWLPIEQIASVEVTSEDVSYPIENALLPSAETGWRAARPGEQTIRLIFDEPQQLRRIYLVFSETEVERSQEFVLRWSSDDGQTFHDIVRQQWNFSPPGSTQETEDYPVALTGVTQRELKIMPDRSGGNVCASLAQLRLA
jgi:hypothetical protein